MIMVSSSRRVASVDLAVRRWSSIAPFAMAVAVEPAPEEPARIDRVSLSAAARERAAAAAAGKRSGLSVLSEAVHADPSQAAWLAHDFAYFDDHPLLEASTDAFGQMRYAATGEPVTAESEAQFDRQAARARAGRVAVYESELSRGTEPAEIFDKLVAFMATQSEDFLRHTGWQNILQMR